MGIKKFGVLYLDGKIAQPGTSCSGLASGQKPVERTVTFGDSQSEESNIAWVQVDNLWVAINSYLLNISYKELEDTGLALGRVVRIDGVPYQCRSLNLTPYYTADGQVRDEWVNVLEKLAGWKNIWPKEGQGAWGCGCDNGGRHYYSDPRFGKLQNSRCGRENLRNPAVGFRPVLEPLKEEPVLNDSLIGSIIVVYGPGHVICGRLVGVSDYDLVLERDGSNCQTDYGEFASVDGSLTVVNRALLLYTQKDPVSSPIKK